MEHHKETFTLRTLVRLLTGIAQTYPLYHPVRYHDGTYLVLCETSMNQRASYLFYRLENNTFLFCGRVLVSHGRIYLSSVEGGRTLPSSSSRVHTTASLETRSQMEGVVQGSHSSL